jgi:hypothetical protein
VIANSLNKPTTFWGATRRSLLWEKLMGWTLNNRKTGKSRSFTTLEKAREATSRAAAKYGTRLVSLRPKRQKARTRVRKPTGEGG